MLITFNDFLKATALPFVLAILCVVVMAMANNTVLTTNTDVFHLKRGGGVLRSQTRSFPRATSAPVHGHEICLE